MAFGAAAACLQHSVLAVHPSAPDLTIALLAWIAAATPVDKCLGRVWLVSMVRDLIDPAAICGHTVCALVVVTVLHPLLERWRVHGPAAVPLWVVSLSAAELARVQFFSGGGTWIGLGDWLIMMLTTTLWGLGMATIGRLLPPRFVPLPQRKRPTWFAPPSV